MTTTAATTSTALTTIILCVCVRLCWIHTIMIGKQSIIIKKSLSNNDSLLCGIKTIISMMIAITVIILYTSSLFSVYALHYWASPSQPIQFFRQKLENIEVNVFQPKNIERRARCNNFTVSTMHKNYSAERVVRSVFVGWKMKLCWFAPKNYWKSS